MRTKKEVRTSWTMLALAAAALGLFLCACSGPAPEAAEGTVAATAPEPEPEATADASADEPNAAPVADERPRPPDDADPLVIAEYYFEPEVWAAVHRPPDRVPDEVLAALGRELPRSEKVHCQRSNRPDRRLRIVSIAYGFYIMPFDALRTKKVEEISSRDFEMSHWGFPFSCSPQRKWPKMLKVELKDGRWESGGSEDMGFPTWNFQAFEKKNHLGDEPIQRRAIGQYGINAYYIIVIPGNGTLEDGRFHYIDPMWGKRGSGMDSHSTSDIFTPVDESIGFQEFVARAKDEVGRLDKLVAKSEEQSWQTQSEPSRQEGAE